MTTTQLTNESQIMKVEISGIVRECEVIETIIPGKETCQDMQRRGWNPIHKIVRWTNGRGKEITSLLWQRIDGTWTV